MTLVKTLSFNVYRWSNLAVINIMGIINLVRVKGCQK